MSIYSNYDPVFHKVYRYDSKGSWAETWRFLYYSNEEESGWFITVEKKWEPS